MGKTKKLLIIGILIVISLIYIGCLIRNNMLQDNEIKDTNNILEKESENLENIVEERELSLNNELVKELYSYISYFQFQVNDESPMLYVNDLKFWKLDGYIIASLYGKEIKETELKAKYAFIFNNWVELSDLK